MSQGGQRATKLGSADCDSTFAHWPHSRACMRRSSGAGPPGGRGRRNAKRTGLHRLNASCPSTRVRVCVRGRMCAGDALLVSLGCLHAAFPLHFHIYLDMNRDMN